MNLIETLVEQLGVNGEQAQGGAGVLLNLVKEHVSGDDFSQIAGAIPDVDDMLSAAPDSGGGLGGMLGSLGGMLGGKAGQMGQLAEAAQGFSKLDLDAGMVGKFIPVIIDFVKEQAGDDVMAILQKVLKSG